MAVNSLNSGTGLTVGEAKIQSGAGNQSVPSSTQSFQSVIDNKSSAPGLATISSASVIKSVTGNPGLARAATTANMGSAGFGGSASGFGAGAVPTGGLGGTGTGAAMTSSGGVGSTSGAMQTPGGASGADSMTGNAVATGSGSSDQLFAATKNMQETQMSFNLQYLQLQNSMQNENRQFTMVSNIMKTKHDTVKNSISNIR